MDALTTGHMFLFEDFRLDSRGLSRRDQSGTFAPIPIGSRALEVLGVLVARSGDLVTRDEIIKKVWPGTIVEYSNLPVQIAALRRVLDHGRTQGSCIQTVPGRGYRFVVAVANPVAQAHSVSRPADGGGEDAETDARPMIASFPTDAGERWPVSRNILGAVPSTRRLAAIIAADVAGYSRLMGADEEGTHERLRAHFRQLIDRKILEHRGRIVKNTGDGLLAEFASVVDAVRCAAEMQRGMIDREPQVPDERRIKFRIGINLGDVIAEGGDIFGDGVNVAAWLETLAEPGGICVSGVVRDQIRDKFPFPLEDLGEQSVKNIVRPVRVYALRPEAIADLPASSMPIVLPRRRPAAGIAIAAVAGAALVLAVGAWWLWPATKLSRTPELVGATSISQPRVAPRLSIVVLPFANLGDDPKQQYFADGITEDFTTDLSRITDMLVISHNSAFTYKDKPANAKQIGRELGVRYVLEGSVEHFGDRVRINAQLIDAETNMHFWAERFDHDAGDFFTLQDEITHRLAGALNANLIKVEASHSTDNPDALDYILRGRAAENDGWTRENYARAIDFFERARALDPRSAEAQTLLANVLVNRVLRGQTDTAAADTARADELVEQALVASPASASVHSVKAQILRIQGRCPEAIPEFERAIAANRNFSSAYGNLGWCKFLTGSIDEMIPLAEQAIRLNPRDPFVGTLYDRIGHARLLQSRTDEAIAWFKKALIARPIGKLGIVHLFLASAYALQGETELAASELAQVRRFFKPDTFNITWLKAHMMYRPEPGPPPAIRALDDRTYFAGLRKAGMPEQ